MEKIETNAADIEKIEKIETPAATEPPAKAGSKRTLTEAQRAQVMLNLEKGRETKRRMKEERLAREAAEREDLDKTKEQLVLKKAAQIQRKKTALKKELAVDSSDSEEEVFVRFDKKDKHKKKKRIVYKTDSESEEEVEVRRKPRAAAPRAAPVRATPVPRTIAFW